MPRFAPLALTVCLLAASAAPAVSAPPNSATVAAALKADLQAYLQKRRVPEHVSAASLTVSLASGKTIDVAAGTVAYDGGAAVSPANLFQIGSNTKAFTSTIVLHLQTAGKLRLQQTLGDWLPQYPQWKNVPLWRLLDMTSGIETYDNTLPMQRALSADPYRFFSAPQLVDYVTKSKPLAGWNYSNTGYILSQLVIEKITHRSYADVLRGDVFGPTGIADLYYYPNIYPKALRMRTVEGYFFNDEPLNKGLMPLYGKSQRDYTTSWTQAAGGIVATPHAVALWARDLYQGTILNANERAQIEKLVSMKTGQPISAANAADRGFGLGVGEMTLPGMGKFWFYEGETLGYRMVHAYFPKENVVIAVGLNSQPRDDKVGQLVQSIVATLKTNGLFQPAT